MEGRLKIICSVWFPMSTYIGQLSSPLAGPKYKPSTTPETQNDFGWKAPLKLIQFHPHSPAAHPGGPAQGTGVPGVGHVQPLTHQSFSQGLLSICSSSSLEWPQGLSLPSYSTLLTVFLTHSP